MKVTITAKCEVDGTLRDVGDVVDTTEETATALINAGNATAVDAPADAGTVAAPTAQAAAPADQVAPTAAAAPAEAAKDAPATFDFGQALATLIAGGSVARAGWNAHHSLSYVAGAGNALPFILMTVGGDAADLQGKQVPWVASHTDLLAQDWAAVE